MKAEPLNIRDERFPINRMIEQAPKSTLVREFFDQMRTKVLRTRLRGIGGLKSTPRLSNGVPKRAIWNTGVGMDGKTRS